MKKCCPLIVLAGLLLLTAPGVCCASVTYSYVSGADEYMHLASTESFKLSLALATVANAELYWTLKSGTSGTYKDLAGNSYTYGAWYALPVNSNGIDLLNLAAVVDLDFKLKVGTTFYDLKEGQKTYTSFPGPYQNSSVTLWTVGNPGMIYSLNTSVAANAVPLPGTAILFGSGLAGLLGLGTWRRREKTAA